jgi:hypothetical protein
MNTKPNTTLLPLAVLVALSGFGPTAVAAQDDPVRDMKIDSLKKVYPPVLESVAFSEDEVPTDPFAARAPFGPGERLVYKVKVGVFGVGEGYMSVVGLDEYDENPVYKIQMAVQGGLGPAKVNDMYQSWFDVSTLQTWRYVRDIDEVGYQSYRHWEFFPERMRWERQDIDEAGDLGSALPIDEIAFVYFVRTLPLEVGKTYTFNRYFKEDGNPVTVRVVRKDRRETEGVWYNTIVVEPEIKTDGLFGEGGEAEIHLTDDERRIPVYVKSDIPKFPGSLTLHLRSIQEGVPLHPESRAKALEGRAKRTATAEAEKGDGR